MTTTEKPGFDDEKVQPATDADLSYDVDPKSEFELGVGGRAPLQRRLRNYHVTMIGFCSGIGTGLFVGTGSAYAKAGPAGLLLAYIVVGMILWAVMQSIAELATLFPTAGSFPHWATRFVDPAVGFSLAISYGYCYTIAIASEVSAAAVIVSYWTDITPAVVITVGLVLILWINLMSVRFYGESEVFGGGVKVLCFIGLVFVSLVITAGGGPTGDAIGFRYWNNPGPWTNYNGVTGPRRPLFRLPVLIRQCFFQFHRCRDSCYHRLRISRSPPRHSQGHAPSHLPHCLFLYPRSASHRYHR